MSPVVRKWGTRLVVIVYTVVFSTLSVVLVSSVFAGGEPNPNRNVFNPETWFEWSERYGLPLVILVIAGWMFFRAVRAVWEFMRPIAQRYAEAGLELINRQNEFVNKMDERQDNIEKMFTNEHGGHQQTQRMLTGIERQTEETNRNVKDMHDKFGH